MKPILNAIWTAIKQKVAVPFGLLAVLFLLAAFEVYGWFGTKSNPETPVISPPALLEGTKPTDRESRLQRDIDSARATLLCAIIWFTLAIGSANGQWIKLHKNDPKLETYVAKLNLNPGETVYLEAVDGYVEIDTTMPHGYLQPWPPPSMLVSKSIPIIDGMRRAVLNEQTRPISIIDAGMMYDNLLLPPSKQIENLKNQVDLLFTENAQLKSKIGTLEYIVAKSDTLITEKNNRLANLNREADKRIAEYWGSYQLEKASREKLEGDNRRLAADNKRIQDQATGGKIITVVSVIGALAAILGSL